MEQKNLNLYNPDAPLEYVNEVLLAGVTQQHVLDWFRTTFVRALKRNPAHACLMLPKPLDFITAPSKPVKFYDEPPTEDWAIRAILTGSLYYWDPQPAWTKPARYSHMVDYCMTLPAEPIRHSVEVMVKEVAKWDKRLARQKLLEDLGTGIEEVWRNETHKIVRLVTPRAFEVEGSHMKHCIWSSRYDRRSHSQCFSLRGLEDNLPVATMQVVEVSVHKPDVQSRPTGLLAAIRRPKAPSKNYTLVPSHMLAQSYAKHDAVVPEENQLIINDWFAETYGQLAVNRLDKLRDPPLRYTLLSADPDDFDMDDGTDWENRDLDDEPEDDTAVADDDCEDEEELDDSYI